MCPRSSLREACFAPGSTRVRAAASSAVLACVHGEIRDLEARWCQGPYNFRLKPREGIQGLDRKKARTISQGKPHPPLDPCLSVTF